MYLVFVLYFGLPSYQISLSFARDCFRIVFSIRSAFVLYSYRMHGVLVLYVSCIRAIGNRIRSVNVLCRVVFVLCIRFVSSYCIRIVRMVYSYCMCLVFELFVGLCWYYIGLNFVQGCIRSVYSIRSVLVLFSCSMKCVFVLYVFCIRVV